MFEVEHIALARRYALKVLRTKVVERDAGAAQKFLREARTAARVVRYGRDPGADVRAEPHRGEHDDGAGV